MSAIKYTYDWYSKLLNRCREAGRSFNTFQERASEGVWLRHDVDWSPANALKIAEIEAEHNAISTYFILVRSVFYNALEPETLEYIRQIADLGHSVGLHFTTEPYFETRPNDSDLLDAVETDQAVLRERLSEVTDVIAFHSPPSWALGQSFEDLTHTYEPAFFENIAYRSDSVGRWREDRPFPDGIPGGVQILTHPTLWGETDEPARRRVREVQREMVARTDRSMQESRIDWSMAKVDW